MKNANENLSDPVRVSFRKQGGKMAHGIANARKGSQLRISYRITNGEARERWFPKSRYEVAVGDIESLPRYVSRSCKGSKLPAPICTAPMTCADRNALYREIAKCEACGAHHVLDVTLDEVKLTDEQAAELEAWNKDPRPYGERPECPHKNCYSKADQEGKWQQRESFNGRGTRKLDDELVED